MAQVVKKDISILDCTDRKFDMNTSLYIYELEDRTVCKTIVWEKEWNSKNDCYKYYATYKNQVGMKVKLELLADRRDGIELEVNYTNHGRLIKFLLLTEWDYQAELEDLLEAVEVYCKGVYSSKKEELTNPYYNRKTTTKKKEPAYTVTKVRNSRGLKADRLLKNVEFSYNCEILGEIKYKVK